MAIRPVAHPDSSFLRDLDGPGRLPGGVLDRYNLIVFPVHDERRRVHFPGVFSEVGLRKRLDDLMRRRSTRLCGVNSGYLVSQAHPVLPHLVVDAEILRRLGPPNIDCVLRVMIAALPIDIGRNEIHIARIFRIAPPRIAYVVKIIRSEHMPSQAPAAREPLVGPSAWHQALSRPRFKWVGISTLLVRGAGPGQHTRLRRRRAMLRRRSFLCADFLT